MKYYCAWSGGKDSTATIILAHMLGLPLDGIVFAEVMFDKVNGISGEDPAHIDFIMNVAKPIFEQWGYPVYIVRSDKDYLDVFNHVIERPIKHFEHQGKTYGFPLSKRCSIKRDCKINPINDFFSSIDGPVTQYVGIAVDEPSRLASLHKNPYKISLLEEYGYTECMAKELCEKFGLYSPSYENSHRGGCWMCPNAKLCEHRNIRRLYKDAWDKFVSLEQTNDLAFPKWNIFSKETLRSREELFQKEDSKIS